VRESGSDDIAHAIDLNRLILDGICLRGTPKELVISRNVANAERIVPKVAEIAAQHLTDYLIDAPPIFKEFVPRKKLLAQMFGDWLGYDTRITCLTGIGGEGKTSLTRSWLDQLSPKPTAVFWWSCYSNPDPDKLLSTLLEWLTGWRRDLPRLSRGGERVTLILALLRSVQIVVVLDGFEVLQHATGDHFGSIADGDLKALLAGFCHLGTQSRIVITTRFPLADLAGFTSFELRPLDRLDEVDGIALLRNFGVTKGGRQTLIDLVHQWDGHALTLSLVGSYIKTALGGDASRSEDIKPARHDSQYDKVERVLARYDKNIGISERSFLRVLSSFRGPVEPSVIATVLRSADIEDDPAWPLKNAGREEITSIVKRLMTLALVRVQAGAALTLHPLIKSHYQQHVNQLPKNTRSRFHGRIVRYYQDERRAEPDHLLRWIEVIYHQCQGDQFDDAFRTYCKNMMQAERHLLRDRGANQLMLVVLGWITMEGSRSTLTNSREMGLSLSWFGACLEDDGRFREATEKYSSALDFFASGLRPSEQFAIHAQVLRICTLTGEVVGRKTAVTQITQRIHQWTGQGDRNSEAYIYRDLLRLECIQENHAAVGACISAIRSLGHHPFDCFLAGMSVYFEYLLRQGKAAEVIAEITQRLSGAPLPIETMIAIHRSLADAGSTPKTTMLEYDRALGLARRSTLKLALMGTLCARGKFSARIGNVLQAQADLDEALDIALDSGCKIAEADIRVGLAWLHISEGRRDRAYVMARRALLMANQMEYGWARDDAMEVLSEIGPAAGAFQPEESMGV
jgi:tetratricopeptide (TPR) repeat protein